MPLQIIHQDITTVVCNAIVNPTDSYFSGSGGTDLAIHKAAGPKLRKACDALPQLNPSEIAVTDGYQLPCRYVFHTVGPVWVDGSQNESALLRACYVNALLKASELGLKSIAFPLISSGTFGFPKDKVLQIALESIGPLLTVLDTEMDVFLCIINSSVYELNNGSELERYLRVDKPRLCASQRRSPALEMEEAADSDFCVCAPCMAPMDTLDDWLKQQDDTFAVTLMKLMDAKNIDDVQCYKKANVSRKTYSKIMTSANYRPSKPTILAFAIALRLTLEETDDLLRTVGYSLSHSNTFDMIITFYIQHGIYDIHEINAALYKYDQLCLGC